jgi:hypothetical protein
LPERSQPQSQFRIDCTNHPCHHQCQASTVTHERPFCEECGTAISHVLAERRSFSNSNSPTSPPHPKSPTITRREEIAPTGEYEFYTWDQRNRLTSVGRFDSLDTLESSVSYGYDYLNQLVSRTEDADGDENTPPTTVHYVYDQGQILLQLDNGDEFGSDSKYAIIDPVRCIAHLTYVERIA